MDETIRTLQAHLDGGGLRVGHGEGLAARAPGDVLASLVSAGLDRWPLPGQGRTLVRWQALAAVAARDLSLVKLFEAQVDALAILAELEAPPWPTAASGARATWGVWCAEASDARLQCSRPDREAQVRVDGRKPWCSGAAALSHALVSAWNESGESCLVAVELDQPGITITDEGWHAVGMAATASVDVVFKAVRGVQVGPPGAYLSRTGFWQGGAGIAACWYGAAAALGEAVRARGRAQAGKGAKVDPHLLAHLGAIDTALVSAATVLRETASWIDRHPAGNARCQALRARLAVEAAATEVLLHAGRALGAGPQCRDAGIARRMADLPVFLRQSHAERDLAALGQHITVPEATPWDL